MSIEFLQTFNYQQCQCMRAIEPVFVQFLLRLQKEHQRETTNKKSNKTCEKTLSKP